MTPTASGRCWRSPTVDLVLFAVIVAAWLPALGNGFAWDDLNNLVYSGRLRAPGAVLESFLHPAMWSAGVDEGAAPTYRPLALASFAIDFRLFGGAAWGFHLSSILLHALAQLLVFRLFLRWAAAPVAAAGALLTGLHPIAIPAVAWINGRSEPLALLFGVAALVVVTGERLTWKRTMATGALLLLSMLGKETGAVFIPLAAIAAGIAHQRFEAKALVAGISAFGVWLLLRGYALRDAGALPHTADDVASLFTALGPVWMRGLQAVVAPLDRSIVPLSGWIAGLSTATRVGYTIAGAIVPLGLLWLLITRRWRALLGLSWFFAVQLMVPALILYRLPGHYRWLYLGLPGLLIGVHALAGHRLMTRPAAVVVGVALACALLQTERAIPVWNNDAELFMTMMEEHPDDPYGYYGFAASMLDVDRPADAERAARMAVERGGDRGTLFVVFTQALARLDRCDEAQARYRFYPDNPLRKQMAAVEDLGRCFLRAGRREEARRAMTMCAPVLPSCRATLHAEGLRAD